MKAKIKYSHKVILHNRYIIQLSIHEVGNFKHYPDGIKYGLICFDNKTGKKVLLDNHHPKGPHVHLDELEISYQFVDEEKLIEDFKRMVWQHLEVKI